MDASSARWFIDFGSTGTSSGTMTISDCIMGQSSAVANGVRPGAMTLSVTGSYKTSDFVDVNGVFLASLTSYAGASTSLWTDPVGGVFTFLDVNFVGIATSGAPRWKP